MSGVTKAKVVALGVLAVGALLVSVAGGAREYGKMKGRAEAAELVADSVGRLLREAVAATTAAHLQVDRAQTRLLQTRALTDSLLKAQDSVLTVVRQDRDRVRREVVRNAGADSAVVREAVEEVAETYEAEVGALKQQVGVLQLALAEHNRTIAAQGRLIGRLNDENDLLRQHNSSLEAQIRAMQPESPGHSTSTLGTVAAAAFALGLGVDAVFGNGG